ncbi:MAG: hypothetical protein VYE18_01105 [Pseudomonadota bacterium]|nr:hypothetical protein [Pseudomonadota bacterium]
MGATVGCLQKRRDSCGLVLKLCPKGYIRAGAGVDHVYNDQSRTLAIADELAEFARRKEYCIATIGHRMPPHRR